jgi:hypothetical protein
MFSPWTPQLTQRCGSDVIVGINGDKPKLARRFPGPEWRRVQQKDNICIAFVNPFVSVQVPGQRERRLAPIRDACSPPGNAPAYLNAIRRQEFLVKTALIAFYGVP